MDPPACRAVPGGGLKGWLSCACVCAGFESSQASTNWRAIEQWRKVQIGALTSRVRSPAQPQVGVWLSSAPALTVDACHAGDASEHAHDHVHRGAVRIASHRDRGGLQQPDGAAAELGALLPGRRLGLQVRPGQMAPASRPGAWAARRPKPARRRTHPPTAPAPLPVPPAARTQSAAPLRPADQNLLADPGAASQPACAGRPKAAATPGPSPGRTVAERPPPNGWGWGILLKSSGRRSRCLQCP